MITVDRRRFTQGLALAQTVADRRSTIPILSSARISANGKLAISTTDLDTSALVEMPYNGNDADFCLPDPRSVISAINAAGSSEVRLQPGEEGEVGLSSGHLAAEIKTLPADDFPADDRIAHEDFSADLGVTELRQIGRVMAAMSKDECRYYLNGVCVRKVGDWSVFAQA